MRLSIPASPARVGGPSRSVSGARFGTTIGALLVAAVVANLTHDRLFHRDLAATAGAPTASAPPEPPADPNTVTLPEGKLRSAGIAIKPVETVDLPREVALTGLIEADPTRHVVVRPRTPGVVRSNPVRPGTKVRAGDVLVVLTSPDIGSARLKVREAQRKLVTDRVEAAWKAEIAANAEAMIAELRRGTTPPQLARQFAEKRLGAARGTLLTSYAELENAAHEQDKQAELRAGKITGEHPLFVAQHLREGAQARFEAALEQVRFDVAQGDRIARQAVRNAEEAVVDAAERLRVLGVAEEVDDLLAHPERASALPSGSEDLTSYPILAPFDGTILATTTVVSQRVELADPLFTLADLGRVAAVANIAESDFAALPDFATAGGSLRLTAAAYPGRSFAATMLYAGAEVDPVTRKVRLVAEAANPDGLLKLGMFARIALDASTTEALPAVPAGAVVDLDGKPAVFVPGRDERSFAIRPVELGREAHGRRSIRDGLKPGDRVVTAGAFALKSEWVLQRQGDED